MLLFGNSETQEDTEKKEQIHIENKCKEIKVVGSYFYFP